MLNGNRVNAIRARMRRGWSIKKIVRVFAVSRNTVRRYTRAAGIRLGSPSKRQLSPEEERDLLQSLARRWERRDPDELEAVLTAKLAAIYSKKATRSNWKAYLTKALKRTMMNWRRARRRREQRVIASSRTASEPDAYGDVEVRPPITEGTIDVAPLLERMRQSLPDFLVPAWDALVAEDFDQTRAADRLGIHRNTMGRRFKQIRKALADLENTLVHRDHGRCL